MSHTKLKQNNEFEARKAAIEDMFYDYSRSQAKIYWINFWRGIFFGLGSVLGGTVLITVLVWLLGRTEDLPILGEAIKAFITVLQHK